MPHRSANFSLGQIPWFRLPVDAVLPVEDAEVVMILNAGLHDRLGAFDTGCGAAGKFSGAFDGNGVWQSLHGAFASGGLIAPISASFQIRHPRPHHGPLVFRVMSAVVIEASDKAKRIVSGVFLARSMLDVPTLRSSAALLRVVVSVG